MRRPRKAISSTASASGAVLLAAMALAGCGSSSGGTSSGKIPFSSSVVEGGELPAHYTCDGANVAPPLKWGATPTGTKELVLIALGKGQSNSATSTVEWAMAGVKPDLHELTAGERPTGAFLVQASDGKRHYSVCPAKGQTKLYAFVVYAVPERVIVTRRVSGSTLYHNLAEGRPEFRAPASGEFTASYTRK
jgi:phosphatidylethanolamine-binding protein (PEBP) family uncharacterized protein